MKLSTLPKWFLDREDSWELIGRAFKHDPNPFETLASEVFQSVFVLGVEKPDLTKDEKYGETDGPIEFHGFDVAPELMTFLSTLDRDENTVFIYNTKKKIGYEVRNHPVLVPVKEDEVDTEPEPEEKIETECGPIPQGTPRRPERQED